MSNAERVEVLQTFVKCLLTTGKRARGLQFFVGSVLTIAKRVNVRFVNSKAYKRLAEVRRVRFGLNKAGAEIWRMF